MTCRSLLVSLAFTLILCPAAIPAPAPAGAAPQFHELQWPQSFDLRGAQVHTFVFAVTQPGPIVLDVKSQGAPLDVMLQGSAAPPLEQQGTGPLRISYVVTPQDVQRGVFWRVILRLTPAAAQAGATSVGTAGVQHPPANPKIVQQAAQAVIAQRHIPSEQEHAQTAAKARAQRDALFNARVAAGEQELVQRRTAIYQNLQPAVEDMRRQKAAALALPAPSSAAPEQPAMNTRALPPQRLTRPTAPPQPVITSLSAPEGVPGDGIMINGSGFGTTDGEVHFVIGADPSLDRTSAPGAWVNNQIFVAVPDPAVPDPSIGAQAYNGVVYVVVGGVKSNLVPFRFDPIIDHRMIRIPADYILGTFGSVGLWQDHSISRENNNFVSSASGDDKFFRNTLLQNGWIVESVPVAYNNNAEFSGGGIALVLGRVGTNSPYTDVFSWVDAMSVWGSGPWGFFDYSIEVPIKGPRGLPDGVVCTSKPAMGQVCPNTQ